jgi:hypothetical protein
MAVYSEYSIHLFSWYICILNYMFDIRYILSSLYVCMAIKHIIVLFVETPRKFITEDPANNNNLLLKIRAYGSKALH